MKTLTGNLRSQHQNEPSSRSFVIFGQYAIGDDKCVYQVCSREDAISFLVYDTHDINISFNYAEDGEKWQLIKTVWSIEDALAIVDVTGEDHDFCVAEEGDYKIVASVEFDNEFNCARVITIEPDEESNQDLILNDNPGYDTWSWGKLEAAHRLIDCNLSLSETIKLACPASVSLSFSGDTDQMSDIWYFSNGYSEDECVAKLISTEDYIDQVKRLIGDEYETIFNLSEGDGEYKEL